MPNIKPISDLCNYSEVLKDVTIGNPLFLTLNGRGQFAVVDLKEYEQLKAELKLLSALAEGERSAREHGWLSLDEVEERLGITHD